MSKETYDVVIVGAGFSGLYMLHKMRELGFSARVFEAVANARAKMLQAGTSRDAEIDASRDMSSALSRLLALSERYPDLKADAQFARLLSVLELPADERYATNPDRLVRRAGGYGKPHRHRARSIQQRRPRVQHARPQLPDEPARKADRLHDAEVLRGTGVDEGRSFGQVLNRLCPRFH